jgi:hypothetical protein
LLVDQPSHSQHAERLKAFAPHGVANGKQDAESAASA